MPSDAESSLQNPPGMATRGFHLHTVLAHAIAIDLEKLRGESCEIFRCMCVCSSTSSDARWIQVGYRYDPGFLERSFQGRIDGPVGAGPKTLKGPGTLKAPRP